MMIILALGMVLLLSGCGGEHVTQVTQTVAAQRPDLWLAYFGIMGEQLRETAAHVNAAWVVGWNEPNWNTIAQRERVVGMVRDCAAAGITRVILCVDFCLFRVLVGGNYAYRGNDGLADLKLLVDDLKATNVWLNIVALTPCDEPDVHGLDDATMNIVNAALRLYHLPIAMIYGDNHKWPGLGTVDWAGFDKYGAGVGGDGCLQDLQNRLGPSQRIILLAGGANPWRDPIGPVLNYANADPQVCGIVAFIYGDRGADAGIRNNGMLPEYAKAGLAIKTAESK